jgi:hypothetical protein
MKTEKCIYLGLLFSMFFALGNASAQPSGCLLPPGGVVAWWPGDGASMHWGAVAAPLNGVVYSTGIVGQAFELDGVSAYLETSLDAQPGLLPETTWEAWVYPTRLGWNVRQQILRTLAKITVTL